MKTTFIYALKDPETGEVRYVGKSDEPKERLLEHVRESRRRKNHRSTWINSVVSRGLLPTLEVLDEVASVDWQACEAAHIQFFREGGANLVNGTAGGECGPYAGGSIPGEVREKMSLAHRGQRNHFFGKTHSPEARLKIGAKTRGRKNPNVGRQHSLEARARMSAAHKGKPWSAARRAAENPGRVQ